MQHPQRMRFHDDRCHCGALEARDFGLNSSEEEDRDARGRRVVSIFRRAEEARFCFPLSNAFLVVQMTKYGHV